MNLFQIARRASILTLSFIAVVAPASEVAATSARLPAGNHTTTPRAVTPYTSFNFGDVYTGEVISQIFMIKNEGDADLVIKDFIAGCACSIATSDKVIPPGKEGTATLEVQTVSQLGGIYKIATMRTNDPERPSIQFGLIANVLRGTPLRQGRYIGPIFLSPDTRAGMYAAPGKTATTEFSVTAETAPVKLLEVEGATKSFLSRVDVVEPGKSYKIIVESVATETPGLYTDKLQVFTDNPALPSFPVDVSLRVYPKNSQ